MKRLAPVFSLLCLLCLALAPNVGRIAARPESPAAPAGESFDGAALFDLIAPAGKADDPERGDKLLDYARRFQEARVQGLDKLRAALPAEADRQFLEDWLFFERCRFATAFLGRDERDAKRLEDGNIRQTVLRNLGILQDFAARLLQEKVDFLLEGLKTTRTRTPRCCGSPMTSPAWRTPAAIPPKSPFCTTTTRRPWRTSPTSRGGRSCAPCSKTA